MKLKKMICIALLLAMLVQLTACAEAEKPPVKTGTVDLMENVTPVSVTVQEGSDSNSAAMADFAISLLQKSNQNENCILSPYSIYTVLAMTANGADSQTLRQMEEVLGMSAAELNVYLYSLSQNCGAELQSANSIWLRNSEDFSAEEEFLQINADFYGADIFSADFDTDTLHELNAWIFEKTDGRIDSALERIDPNTMMYLINALTFESEWKTPYDEFSVREDVFHAENGDIIAQMMSSEESVYLDDGKAIGFMKPYKNEQYSFVALLPNGDIGEYISTLSADSLLNTVKNASENTVFATMPKLELTYSALLKDTLSAMGMPDAFTDSADFSRISNTELFISEVLHKTYLRVDELGTQAGASTVVVMDAKGFAIDAKTVVLDRPFVMGIYDNLSECFIFLGAVHSPK